MIKTILYPFKHFAWFKRLNAKIMYEFLARRVQAEDWHFMNYGYMPCGHEKPVEVDATVNQPYPLQMYHCLASKIKIEGKDLLEVGSGRGGGARHIATSFKPASYIGMDIAQSAVDLANKLHCLPNLKFIQGSAEAIPLADSSVDVVLNVESCHAYGSVCKFLSEVKRVLRPGGYLMLVDFRDAEKMETLKSQLDNTEMKCIEARDISENVVLAMEAEDAMKKKRITHLVSHKWQKLFAEFAGVVGSGIYRKLKSKERLYYSFVVQKPS